MIFSLGDQQVVWPVFAYLALQAPHDPFQLPADWLDRYKGRYDQGYEATRAQRIARMKALGILGADAGEDQPVGKAPLGNASCRRQPLALIADHAPA